MENKKYSVAEIKKGYEQKREWEKQFPLSYYVFRPVSFHLSSFLTHFTNSPSKVAFFGFFIALSGLLLLPKNLWLGTSLLTIYSLWDAADGNIARATGKVTYYGKLVDGYLGVLSESLLFAFLGVSLTNFRENMIRLHSLGNGTVLGYLGFSATILCLHSSLLENIFHSLKSQKDAAYGISSDIKASITKSRFAANPLYLIFVNLGSYNVQLLLLFISLFSEAADVFLVFYFFYYAARFAFFFIYYFRTAAKELS